MMTLAGFTENETGKRDWAETHKEEVRRMIPTVGYCKAGKIQRILHTDQATVCKAVHLLRMEGHPIGANRNGYFYATLDRREEFETATVSMEQRSRSVGEAAEAMRHSLSRLLPAGDSPQLSLI